jgi:hypothetical protein
MAWSRSSFWYLMDLGSSFLWGEAAVYQADYSPHLLARLRVRGAITPFPVPLFEALLNYAGGVLYPHCNKIINKVL